MIDREATAVSDGGGRIDPELHRLGGGDGGLMVGVLRGTRARRAVAAGRGGACERARDARRARGGGPTLMFNGHMDTSYSGREPWLAAIPGFQPRASSATGGIYGLGSRT